MTEADEVFMKKTDKSHVQYSEIEDLYDRFKNGEVILGVGEEVQKLINDLSDDKLDYSNNTVIDMIIKKVLDKCEDEKLKSILENSKIADIENAETKGRAYPKYFDGSYYIEIDRNYMKRILLLSDYLATVNMLCEQDLIFEKNKVNIEGLGKIPILKSFYSLFIARFLDICLDRFLKNEEFTNDYNEILMKLMAFEKEYGTKISDMFVDRSNNIYEAAIAMFVGHEIGHHYYRHTDEKIKEAEIKRLEDTYRVDSIKAHQFFEYNADAYGTGFAVEYMRSQYTEKTNTVLIHQMVGIFIPMMIMMFDADDLFDDEKKHPALIKRFLRIKKSLESRTDEETIEEVMYYVYYLFDVLGIRKKVSQLGV